MAEAMGRVLEALSEEECYLVSILQDESGLDLAEFCWQANENEDNCFRAWPFQWTWWRCTDPLTLDQCARALDLSTPLPTPLGWTTMGEVSVGDFIFDELGTPVKVTALSPVRNDRPCFEVAFNDHTSIVADEEHLWLTWTKNDRCARNTGRRGRPSPGVRTTGEILATLEVRAEKNHSVDVARPLQTPSTALPIDPYYLGFWLGDGSTITSEITTADGWVLEELERRGFVIVPRKNYLLHGISFPGVHNHKTSSVQAVLRSIGVLGNKHIPQSYLRASESARRDLLAGLIDSDGRMQSTGSCEITQKVERIADDLIELLRSLAETPRKTKKTAYCNGVDCGPVYRVTWRPRVNPALMPRKSLAFFDSSRQFRLSQRRIVDVRPVSTRPVRCLTVDSASHLFLAGEGMIPTHNSIGKSLSIKVRMFVFPFIHPGQEALITAPEKIHLQPVTDLIETQFDACRLGREMLAKNPFGHQPFLARFANGARIMGRIPQRDGRGVKGSHPLWLEQDEASDYPEAGWKEIIETLKRGQDGAMWRAHGVTRGLRDSFYKNSAHGQNDPPLRFVSHKDDGKWTVHRIVAMARPNWTDEERTEKELQYGSRDDPDYRRNVLGSHGDSQAPLFVLSRLMTGVDDDPSTEYNTDGYFNFSIKDTELDRMQADIVDLLAFPQHHRNYKTTWAGADIGYTQDPTEILVFAEYPLTGEELADSKKRGKAVPEKGLSRLKCITRISLRRIAEPAQADVIMHVIDFYKPKVFAMDSTGAGLPLFQQVQRRMHDVADGLGSKKAREAAESIKGYNFSSKIVVDFDETIDLEDDIKLDDRVKESGISRMVLEYSTDVLRTYVDDQRLWLPWDRELIGEMSGQTFSYSKATMDRYGRRRIFSRGTFHALDAMRMAVLGHKQHSIETLLATREAPAAPIFDAFVLG